MESLYELSKHQEGNMEEFLNKLIKEYNCLLHGSRTDIVDNQLNPIVYATNTPEIALMRAIISNRNLKHSGLSYSHFLNEKPLKVNIYGINNETIGDKGYIYVITQTKDFENNPKGSWQYLSNKVVPFIAKIEVQKSDFDFNKYKVIDKTNNKRIL